MHLPHRLDRSMTWCSIVLIRLYQYTISPDKGPLRYWLQGRICAHEPHCSAYAIQSLQRYGFFRGRHYAITRILHCTPALHATYDPAVLRVVFFSSAAIGIPFLEALLKDPRYEVVGVVTVPAQPLGRGMRVQKNVIVQRLEDHGYTIPVFTPRTLRREHAKRGDDAIAVVQQLTNCKPDIFVVIAYGKILPEAVLALPRLGPINVHGSLLPAYRGATPLQSVFLDGKDVSGLTIMLMDTGLDTGPILAQRTIALPFAWSVIDLIEACKKQGPVLLTETVRQWAKKQISPLAQPTSPTALCHKLVKEDGAILVHQDSLAQVYARWRAYALWPKVYFFFGEKRITIESLVINHTDFLRTAEQPLFGADRSLHPAVTTLMVTPAGKKTMEWKAFLLGQPKK